MGSKITSRDSNLPPRLDKTGTPIGDSIYTAFVLQEAVRLVDREDRTIKDGEENALIMCVFMSPVSCRSLDQLVSYVQRPRCRNRCYCFLRAQNSYNDR